MTERERWIVYPLLFLALGAALRDKLSEHTKTKRIECQELVVNGEERVGQPPVPLVHIGSIERKSPDAPHLGQILVNGQIAAQAIQTEVLRSDNIEASNLNADNYFFRRIPFAPNLVRVMPGMAPAGAANAPQQQPAGAVVQPFQPNGVPVDDKPAESPVNAPAATPPAAVDVPADSAPVKPAE